MMYAKEIEILIFRVKQYLIGIDGDDVVEIINVPKIFPLEEKYNFLEGTIDFQKKKVPVISLAKKWGITPNVIPGQIIIINMGSDYLGFLIDSSEAVVKVPLLALGRIHDFIKLRSYADYFWAIMKYKDDIILLLDTDIVLNEEEKKIVKEVLF